MHTFHSHPATGDVELVAKDEDGSMKRVKRSVTGYSPTIFEFSNLKCNTRYIVDIIGPEPLPFAKQAVLKTRPVNRGRQLRFATVSCNNVFIGASSSRVCDTAMIVAAA